MPGRGKDQTLNYAIERHPEHHRLQRITIGGDAAARFVRETGDLSEQRLTYVPYLRLIAADILQRSVGGDFAAQINALVRDRATGGFTIAVEGGFETQDQRVAFGTAVSHLIGMPNFDDMTGNYYACFEVRDADDSDSYLRQAYRLFTLHTDGTYIRETTDWILMMKMAERDAVGGESRLLHLDDWEALARFARHPLASLPMTYQSPPSKNYPASVEKTAFYERDGKACVCFIDQFAYPKTIAQARYLRDLSDSMEASAGVVPLSLPPDHLLVLNNHFWLHGREPFKKHPDLYRLLMRQRGYFREERYKTGDGRGEKQSQS